MGLFERTLRAQSNRQLAAARQLVSPLPPEGAFEQVLASCQDVNGRVTEIAGAQQGAKPSFRDVVDGLRGPAGPRLLGTFVERHSDDLRTIHVACPSAKYFDTAGTGTTGLLGRVCLYEAKGITDGTLVELTLLRWSIRRSTGRIHFKEAWLTFAETLADRLLANHATS